MNDTDRSMEKGLSDRHLRGGVMTSEAGREAVCASTLQVGRRLLITIMLLAWGSRMNAQTFDVGSNGSLGDVVISQATTMDLPPDGKLHFRSLTLNSGVRLTFKQNQRNTPVYILSQKEVLIDGVIDVNGSVGSGTDGGIAGPGGFAGGKPGFGSVNPGSGYGPGGGGGGAGGCGNPGDASGGSFAGFGSGPQAGPLYGTAFLIPILGGSGGGGTTGEPGQGGGGGGGAIQIASNTRITVRGSIEANGGASAGCLGGGSGGAIRLVALRVEGGGRLSTGSFGAGGSGRIRVDTLETDGIAFQFNGARTVGQNLFSVPSTLPRLDTIEVAGTVIPEGSSSPTITLPFGSSPQRTVKIQARDFGRVVPFVIMLTPSSGPRITVTNSVDNTTSNPAVVEVPVTFPVNSKVTVHCWTR